MSLPINFRSRAYLEIYEAYDWYEKQREGLGLEFLDALELFIEGLRLNPLTHSYYDKPVRQGVLKRFPYTVVYEVFPAEVIVYSVFMKRQDPVKKPKS
jgi:toxin ParE1/3/4